MKRYTFTFWGMLVLGIMSLLIYPVNSFAQETVFQRSDYQSDFKKDEANAKRYAENKYQELNRRLTATEKRHLDELREYDYFRLRTINNALDGRPSEDGLEASDYIDDIVKIDHLFENKTDKITLPHTFYANFDIGTFNKEADNSFDNGTTIDQQKFIEFIDQFQYFNFNGYFLGDLTQKKPSQSERIVMQLSVPRGTEVLFLDDGKAILEGEIGIKVNRFRIFSEGRQYIKIEADLVPKEAIEQEVKSAEYELNQKIKQAWDIGHDSIVKFDTRNLRTNYIANLANENISHLLKVIPEDLAKAVMNFDIYRKFCFTFYDESIPGHTDADGLFDIYENEISIAYDIYGTANKKYNKTIVHEFGHAVDFNLLGKGIITFSEKNESFNSLFHNESPNLSRETSGVVDYDEENDLEILYGQTKPVEYFAEVFKNMYSSDSYLRELIRVQTPKTCEFIEDHLQSALNDR